MAMKRDATTQRPAACVFWEPTPMEVRVELVVLLALFCALVLLLLVPAVLGVRSETSNR
jgi:hypothetical protein